MTFRYDSRRPVAEWIVTAYFPDSQKWEADFKTRKEIEP